MESPDGEKERKRGELFIMGVAMDQIACWRLVTITTLLVVLGDSCLSCIDIGLAAY